MKRVGLAIALYLLLGLATSVAVAWSLAALPIDFGEWLRDRYGKVENWSVFDAHRLGGRAWRAQVLSEQSDAEPIDWLAPWSVIPETVPSRSQFVIGEPVDHVCCIVEKQFGWPWTSLGFSVVDVDREGDMDVPQLVSGISIALLDNDSVRVPGAKVATRDVLFAVRALPMRIDAGRFGANALLWSAIWFVLFAPKWAPRAMRQRYRHTRGRCERCGYDLRETKSGRCSECGDVVGHRVPIISTLHLRVLGNTTLGLILLLVAGATAVTWTRGGVQPIHAAAREGDAPRLMHLMKSGVGANTRLRANDSRDPIDGTTPLMWAAAHGQVDALDVLITHGADCNAVDARGWRALMWAAHYDQVVALKRLIVHGADVDAQNPHGETALIIACKENSPKCAEALIKAGASLEKMSREGTALVHVSPYQRRLPILRMLIDAGAQVDPPLSRARSPLHWAMSARNVEGVRVFLEAGADPRRRTHKGLTVLEHAESEKPIGIDNEIWEAEKLRQIIELLKAALREREP